MTLQIYGDRVSGNCLKVKWTAEKLGIPYAWKQTGVMKGETRTPEFLAMNPNGGVPFVVLEDGRTLTQSGAIMLHLAEGSVLIPADPYDRARMLQWMFWEQNSHEPWVAVARRIRFLEGKDVEPAIMERGNRALAHMNRHLADTPFLVGDDLTLADVALVAYTRMAGDGGFDLGQYPMVQAWVARVEAGMGIAD